MGMVIDGKWVDDDAKHRNPDGGEFVRPQSIFCHRVTADGSTGFKAEPGRYHLFLAPTCPWAHRTQIFRRLKRLEDVISISLSDLPRRQSWACGVPMSCTWSPSRGPGTIIYTCT